MSSPVPVLLQGMNTYARIETEAEMAALQSTKKKVEKEIKNKVLKVQVSSGPGHSSLLQGVVVRTASGWWVAHVQESMLCVARTA